MNIRKPAIGIAAFVMCLALSGQASAAFINIDDSDLANITISAGNFEGGFSVNGTPLPGATGAGGSITLADAGISLTGSWIDTGQVQAGQIGIRFALPGSPTDVTSGFLASLTPSATSGFAGLTGNVGGFVGSTYFTGSPTLLQNGQTGNTSAPFLTVSFVSEVPPGATAVPEPAILALLGLGLVGAGAGKRRRRL